MFSDRVEPDHVDVPALVRPRPRTDAIEAVVGGHVIALLAQLDERLRFDDPMLHRGLASGATPGSITVLENQLGVTIPLSLRLILAWRDGLRDGVRRSSLHLDYQLLGTSEIAQAWKAHPDLFHAGMIPFARSDHGDWLAVETSTQPDRVRGQVLRVRAGCTDRDVRFRNLQGFLEVVLQNRGKLAVTEESRRKGMHILAAAREMGRSA